MKASTFLVGSILLIALASAASLEVQGRHVFEGEEFTVRYTASAPISQHDVTIAFAEQTREITLPNMAVGTFSTTVSFTAPQEGSYEAVSGEARAAVEVEPALVVLEDVRLVPGSVSPGETAELSYTIRNTGEASAHNVKRKVTVASDAFNYNPEEDTLYGTMQPGDSLHKVEQIVARESASGDVNVQVLISYDYDGETHTREEWMALGVSSIDIWMVVGLVLVIAVAGIILSKAKRPSE